MTKISMILHPTDFSGPSEPAFELARALARDYEAELVVAHVLTQVTSPSYAGLAVTPVDPEQATTRLESIQPNDPRVRVCHRFAEGDAVTQIVRLAAEEGADLIVMGTHGQGGRYCHLMGSVAEGVLRHAPCQVLTVRAAAPVSLVPTPAAVEEVAGHVNG